MNSWRTWLVLALLLWPTLVHAHPQAPVSLRVVELDTHTVAVTLRRAYALRDELRIEPPAGCAATSSSSRRDGAEQIDVAAWQCNAPLVGQTLRLPGLRGLGLGALVVVEPRDRAALHATMTADTPTFTVPAAATTTGVVARYVQLGAEHLGAGLDHLLLVAALVLLAAGMRALVTTITAFTLGHSVTLTAVALGVIAPSSALAELAIAATLVVVALQVQEGESRHGPVLALAFGLVHGLGFAGALAELGMPDEARVWALLGFNVGIELGQLAVVLLAWPLWHACRRQAPHTASRVRLWLGYAIGALACMWAIERVLAIV
jgi:HupE/UreJ protein